MKKFIFRLIKVGVLVSILFFIIETLLLFKENEYSYKYSYLQKHKGDIECLILGASVSSNGINPHLISVESFNAATEGRPIYYDYALVREFVPQMKKLKCVLLTLTPSQLYRNYKYEVKSSLSTNNSDPAYRSMHLKYMGLRYDWKDVFYYMETINSYYDYMGRFFNSDEVNRKCDSLGYQELNKVHINDTWRNAHVINTIDYQDKNVEYAVKENISYLKELSEVCQDNNVRLIILWPPFHKAGRAQVNDVDKHYFKQCISELTKSKGVECYNFENDARFDKDEYFYNPTHLNSKGTDIFTRIIDNIVMNNNTTNPTI